MLYIYIYSYLKVVDLLKLGAFWFWQNAAGLKNAHVEVQQEERLKHLERVGITS